LSPLRTLNTLAPLRALNSSRTRGTSKLTNVTPRRARPYVQVTVT
jgi:hypothetical protein